MISDKTATLQRLRSIEGHLGGIVRMVEEDAYCIDVLQQVQAVHAALDKVAGLVLENHLQTCLTTAIRGEDPSERERVLGELLDVYRAGARGSRGRLPGPASERGSRTEITMQVMETIHLKVPAISCGHCVQTITRAVNEVAGVARVSGDVETKQVDVAYAPPATREAIVVAMTEWGYAPAE